MKFLYRNILLSILSAAVTVQGEDNCTTPAPFANIENGPTIHIVMSITTGDFFTQLLEGAKLQAAKIDSENEVQVAISQPYGDDKFLDQAELIDAAANDPNTVGILTVDGSAGNLCDAINTALNTTNVKSVVSFDFRGDKCAPEHILTKQNNKEMALSVLNQAVLNQGMNKNVGYVNDLAFAPLLDRDKVWEEMKTVNNWTQVFFVDEAASYGEALQSAIKRELVAAATLEKVEVDFIYSPWDYLSVNSVKAIKATSSAVYEADIDVSSAVIWNNGTAVYGADINNDDIQVMTESDNWKATAGVDPRAIGAALVRMVAISASGNDLGGDDIEIPVELVTREFLLDNNVTNMDELVLIDPELTLPGFMQACWIDSIAYNSTANDQDGSDSTDEASSSDAGSFMGNKMVPLLLLIPFTALVSSW